MDNSELKSLLQILGERVPPGSQFILIGGGALALLGSPRLTIDIDFVGDDVHPSKLHRSIMEIARELKIDAEPVPLDRFVPLPLGSTKCQIHIGQFGNLEIYVADPPAGSGCQGDFLRSDAQMPGVRAGSSRLKTTLSNRPIPGYVDRYLPKNGYEAQQYDGAVTAIQRVETRTWRSRDGW